MSSFLKRYALEVLIVFAFILFLFAIPKLLNSDSSIEYSLESPVIGEDVQAGKILEITKFQVISDAVLNNFVNVSVEDSNSDVAMKLISENKITNKQNSVILEIISLYGKKQFDDARNLASDVIENRLDIYDAKVDRKWRNEALYIFHKNDTYVVYENINLLVKVPDSEIVGLSKTLVRPYAYQRYNFIFENDTKEVITVDLRTNISDKNLNDFIEIETGAPKVEFKDLKIDFVESDDEYIVEFVVWK